MAKKKPFTSFDCWDVVKDHPSFVAVSFTTPPMYATPPSSATPSSNEESPTINLYDDQVNETPQSNDGSSQSPPKPMGSKAAKERRRLMKQGGKAPVEQQVYILESIASEQAEWRAQRGAQEASELKLYT